MSNNDHLGRHQSRSVSGSAQAGSREEIAAFVAALHQLRVQAGRPSLRSMARAMNYSHTALSSALAGNRLPSLDLTLAFVRTCGGDEQQWRIRWEQASAHRPGAAVSQSGSAGKGHWRGRLALGTACALAGILIGAAAGWFYMARTATVRYSVFLGEPDLSRYCRTQGFYGVSLDGVNAYQWHCIGYGGKRFHLSVRDACRAQYRQPSVVARYDDFDNAFSWQCWNNVLDLGSPDLIRYCQAHGYTSARLDGSTINTWHCISSSGEQGIDQDSACRWQYGPRVLVTNPGLFDAPWDKWECWG